MADPPRGPPSQAHALDAAQRGVQFLLRLTADLGRVLDKGGVRAVGASNIPQFTQKDAAKTLQEYSDSLCMFDQRADGLKRFLLPLEAVQHLDKSGLSLEPWCKGLAGRLRIANERARACVAPLDAVAARLYCDGWASSSSSSSGPVFRTAQLPREGSTLQPRRAEGKPHLSRPRAEEDERQADWAAAYGLDDGDEDSQDAPNLDKESNDVDQAQYIKGGQRLVSGSCESGCPETPVPTTMACPCPAAGIPHLPGPERMHEGSLPARSSLRCEEQEEQQHRKARREASLDAESHLLMHKPLFSQPPQVPSPTLSGPTMIEARSPTRGRAEEDAVAGRPLKKRLKIKGLLIRQ
mmetsp:Transcript_100035/g.198438  ORF Transcript_100035/g.198438 Transcript_100035/m.198438 type:complete len:352 (-) Transcript_100035:529-1584(-)|eukprot:CAMPEP_0172673024 /NCGR_PEP_ID=MMETSP1074-20121228/11898_1 /TAXON_ID=2916 /ORGANISM="Ceratium fusus, Strain PA161109" /LENGTH=351 /DNA_ID=CAMNT_0013490285 /DNA_START=157 /DNA_END=1212 /DNA_ORIENTATION=+